MHEARSMQEVTPAEIGYSEILLQNRFGLQRAVQSVAGSRGRIRGFSPAESPLSPSLPSALSSDLLLLGEIWAELGVMGLFFPFPMFLSHLITVADRT